MVLTSTVVAKEQSYLRGFLKASELLIHHVSSLFCSATREAMCHLTEARWRYRKDEIPSVIVSVQMM